MLRLFAVSVAGCSLLAAPLLAAPSGPFIGGLIGATALKGEHTYSTNGQPSASKLNKISPFLGINGGYLMSLGDDKMGAGVELYMTSGGPEVKKELLTKSNEVNGRFSIKHKGSFGISILTGAMLNLKIMAYARVGYESHTFGIKYSELTFQSKKDENHTKRVAGLAPGGGILYRVTPNFNVMLDATVPVLSKFTTKQKDSAGRTFEYSPAMQRITLRLIYTFS